MRNMKVLVINNDSFTDRELCLSEITFKAMSEVDMILITEKKYFYVAKNRWGNDRVIVPIGLLGLFCSMPGKYGSMI